jgi:hypothetical protein
MINWSPKGNPPFADTKKWKQAREVLSSLGLIGSNQIHLAGVSYGPEDYPSDWNWDCSFDIAQDAKEMWDEILYGLDYVDWDSSRSEAPSPTSRRNPQFKVSVLSDKYYNQAEKQLEQFISSVKYEINEILYEFDLEIDPSEIRVLKLYGGQDEEVIEKFIEEYEKMTYRWADYEIQINVDELRDINDD